MKQRAKKAASHDKSERHRTGGGTYVEKVDSVDEKILAILGNRAQPLVNPYDSDAIYNNESGWLIILLLLKKKLILITHTVFTIF